MKNRILNLFGILVLSIALPAVSFASTASFSPATVSVTAGQSFTMTVYVTPQSGSAYTVKTSISFPPDLLRVSAFSFSSGWLPLSQPGYDSIDNSSGNLVKTAGYSGGFSNTVAFGTITFTAKASGTGSISFTSGTQILDANNQNTFTSGGRASVSITALPVILPPTKSAVPATKTNTPVRTPLSSKTTTSGVSSTSATSTLSEASSTSTSTSPTVAAAGTQTFNTSRNHILYAFLFIATFTLGLWVGKRFI